MSDRKLNQSKRSILCAGIALVAAALCAESGWSQTRAEPTRSIAIQVYPGLFLNLLPWVAQEKGFYEKNGLDVKLVPLGNGPQGLAALEGGSIQLAQNNTDFIMLAIAKGLDLQIVVGNWGQQFTVFARAGFSLPHAAAGYPAVMQDLVGKKIGVTARGSGTEYAMRATLSEAGVDPEAVQYVAVGGTAGQIPALRGGNVDAVVVLIEGASVLRAMGLGTPIVDFQRGEGPRSFQSLSACYESYFGKREWINANGDLLAKFVNAHKEAEAWARDQKNHDELVALMLAKSPLSAVSNQQTVAAEYLRTAPFQTKFDPSCVENWNTLLLKTKLLEKRVDPTALVWSGLK